MGVPIVQTMYADEPLHMLKDFSVYTLRIWVVGKSRVDLCDTQIHSVAV
jgi:hypothetical protein